MRHYGILLHCSLCSTLNGKLIASYLIVIFYLELPEDFVEWKTFCVDRARLSSSNRYLCCTAKLEQESRSRIFMVTGSDSVKRKKTEVKPVNMVVVIKQPSAVRVGYLLFLE